MSDQKSHTQSKYRPQELSFCFNETNLKRANEAISRYPKNYSSAAVMPLLHLAQEQNEGWISEDVMHYISQFLNMPFSKVKEVASFYDMYNLKQIGKYFIKVCRTTPCWLRGSDEILKKCREILGIDINETSGDGLFSLGEVECLGACTDAPIVSINGEYKEKATPESIEKLLSEIRKRERNEST